MQFDRRTVIKSSLSGLALAAIGGTGLAKTEDGFVELIAKPGRQNLTGEAGTDTGIWGYNGSVPGPTIRARAGERIKVRLINQLEQPTSIHWHGIRIDNAMDGVVGLTQDAVQPGDAFKYDFVVPDAGTYWYHTHNRAWEQLARGLYGALIVDEANGPVFDHDIPFILDDWRLNAAGEIDDATFANMHDWGHAGRLGNWLTVNAQSDPEFKVIAGATVRLRVMNTANARVLKLGFGGLATRIIALDGHAIDSQLLGDTLRIAPGQRADLCFRVPDTTNGPFPIFETSGNEPLMFASIAPVASEKSQETNSSELPSLAPTRNLEPDLANAERFKLVMEGGAMGGLSGAIMDGQRQTMRELVKAGRAWAFNGVAGDLTEPLLSVPLGKTVIIDMVNDTRWPHAMHLHGHHFRAIEQNGRPLKPGLVGKWRDTELVEPGDQLAIAFVADNPGKWYFHCHMMEHQAAGMRTWIQIGA